MPTLWTRWARRHPDSRLARKAALQYGRVASGTLAESKRVVLATNDPDVSCVARIPVGTTVSRRASDYDGRRPGADWTFTLSQATTVCDESYEAGHVLNWTSLTIRRQPE